MHLGGIAPLLFNGSLHLALSSTRSCLISYNCPYELPCCSKFGFCGSSWEHCSPGNCVTGCDGGYEGGDSSSSDYGSSDNTPIGYSSGDNTPIEFSVLSRMEQHGVYSGCKNPKHAALTFDDGVNPSHTPRLLDVLREKRVPATFFILGQSLSQTDFWGHYSNENYGQNIETLRRMHRDGHDIASHTFDHTPLTDLPYSKIIEQMDTTAGLIKRAIGVRPHFMRAPEGKLSFAVLNQLLGMGYVAVHWNYNPEDWIHFMSWDSHVLDYIDREIPPASKYGGSGPIILQHDIIESTAYRQAEVIDALRSKGYELVPMHVCLDMRPYQ